MRIILLLLVLLIGVSANCRNIKNKLRCNANKYPRCVWQGSLCTHEDCLAGSFSDRNYEFCFKNCHRSIYDCRCKKCFTYTRAKDCRKLSSCCLWMNGKCTSHLRDTTLN